MRDGRGEGERGVRKWLGEVVKGELGWCLCAYRRHEPIDAE
jgi:hypothetical protein